MKMDAVMVQRAIDGALADVRFTRADEQAVLREIRRRRVNVRGMRVLLIAAAVLLALLTAAGVALSFSRAFYEDVAAIQSESGYYRSWSFEQKVNAVRAMAEYGVISENDELMRLATGKGGEKKREKKIDALMEARYGRLDGIGFDGMLAAELGDMAQWSAEDKAWYSGVLLESGLMGFDEFVFMLPREGDVSPEEAVDIAKRAVAEACGLADDAADGYAASYDFGMHIREYGEIEPYYMVNLAAEDGGVEPMDVWISADGRVMSSEDGVYGVLSPAERAAKQAAKRAKTMTPEEQLAAHEAEQFRLNAVIVPLGQMELSQRTVGLDGELEPFGRILGTRMQVYPRTICSLSDGGIVICGLLEAQDTGIAELNGIFAGMDETISRQAYAVCLNMDGTVRWRFALPERWTLTGGMETADGGILLLARESRAKDVREVDDVYCQLRLGADGQLIEKIALQTTQEMTGIWTEYESLFYEEAGHGGMLISGTAGPKHIRFYAQLDENARPVCVWQFTQAENFSPHMLVMQEGYLLTAYDKAQKRPFMRRYDRMGKQTGEDVMIESVTGRSLGLPQMDAAGNVVSIDSWTETDELRARIIAPDGTELAETQTLFSGNYWGLSPGCTVGDWRVFGLSHALDEEGNERHFCLVMMKPDGTVRRACVDGLSNVDIEQHGVTPVIWPVGKDRIAFVGTRQMTAQLDDETRAMIAIDPAGEDVKATELVLAVVTLPEISE